MKITIVYDNETLREDLKEGHGFSCLVEAEKNILFDTGWVGHDLEYNMKSLGYKISDLDVVILSHNHWDHIGGLPHVLSQGSNLEVYTPTSFSDHMKDEIKKNHNLHEVTGPQRISGSVYTSGELEGRYKQDTLMEQNIILKTSKGPLAIVGCSHQGVRKVLDTAADHGRVFGLIGGLHDFGEYELLAGLDLIVPTHCTQHRLEIRERYPSATQEGGVGWTIDIE